MNIIELAKEAGWTESTWEGFLTKFSALVREDEREKIALAHKIRPRGKSVYPEFLAETVKQEPVAVISKSAIGLVKLHSNGVSLPFGTQLYAAPVDAKSIRADALEEAAKLFDCDDYRSLAAAIRGLK